MGVQDGTEDLSPLCFDLVAEVSNILTPQSTPVLQIWLEHDLNRNGDLKQYGKSAFTAIDEHCLHTHSIAHRATEYHAV